VDTYYDNDKNYTGIFTFNNDFVKLRQVILSYNLNVSKMSFLKLQSASVSLVGRNLLYFFPSRFHDIDVDQYSGRNIYNTNSREPNLQTPTTRSYGFNINVGF